MVLEAKYSINNKYEIGVDEAERALCLEEYTVQLFYLKVIKMI